MFRIPGGRIPLLSSKPSSDMDDLQARIEQLSPDKLALLAKRLGQARQGHKQILAYILGDARLEEESVKEAVRQKLPAYMQPTAIISLDHFPRLPNGKVDRTALPTSFFTKKDNYQGPRNQIEQQMVDIWAEVLTVGQLGVYDNFFEIGGDSILSIQIIAKIRQAGFSLSPNQLLEHPTVAGLSQLIEASTQVESPKSKEEIDNDREDPASFSDAGLSQEDLNTLWGQIDP